MLIYIFSDKSSTTPTLESQPNILLRHVVLNGEAYSEDDGSMVPSTSMTVNGSNGTEETTYFPVSHPNVESPELFCTCGSLVMSVNA